MFVTPATLDRREQMKNIWDPGYVKCSTLSRHLIVVLHPFVTISHLFVVVLSFCGQSVLVVVLCVFAIVLHAVFVSVLLLLLLCSHSTTLL